MGIRNENMNQIWEYVPAEYEVCGFLYCPYVQMDKNGQDRAFFGQISRLEPG